MALLERLGPFEKPNQRTNRLHKGETSSDARRNGRRYELPIKTDEPLHFNLPLKKSGRPYHSSTAPPHTALILCRHNYQPPLNPCQGKTNDTNRVIWLY